MQSDLVNRLTIDELSLAMLEEVRSEVLLAFSFMAPALYALPFEAKRLDSGTLETDGSKLCFDAKSCVCTFRNNPDALVRDYLHVLLHCILRHPFDLQRPEGILWDTACDMAAEAMAMDLAARRFPSPGDDDRRQVVSDLLPRGQKLTVSKAYRLLVGGEILSDEVERFAQLFARDGHGPWPRRDLRHEERMRIARQSRGDDALVVGDVIGDAGEQGSALDSNAMQPEAPESQLDPGAPGGSGPMQDSQGSGGALKQVMDDGLITVNWKDISEEVMPSIEAYLGKHGLDAGTVSVSLPVVNRKAKDYRQFLKRFASLSEEMKSSLDEFDYVYYTFGLKLYGNMPLIEPLEYRETARVREFVIAIDTSESCSAALVRRFVEKTYDILKSEEGFGYRTNVHVVQCDAEIRDVTIIDNVRDLDSYFRNFKARGFGGTDYRPIFKYVDDAIASREFKELKGMVLLTDGNGEYPEYVPQYETVFVFVENEPVTISHVPPWASKVLMDEDAILEL